MAIQDLIASVSESLTKSERKIAEAIAADPTLVAFGTISDLALRAHTSRPTVVRFASRLGFAGYSELQAWVRRDLSRRFTRPSSRIRQPAGPMHAIRSSMHDAIDAVFRALDAHRLEALAAPLAEARNVWIITGETSMAGARALHSGLSMARPGVFLVEEQSVGRDLTSAGEGDACAALDFSRYRRHSINAARVLSDMGVRVVAITDGPLSPLASLTPTWCELSIPAVGPFDSSVPAVLAAELLVSAVVHRLGDAARERIDRLETLWQATDTYLEYTPRPASERTIGPPDERLPAP